MSTHFSATVVEEELQLSLDELCRACRAQHEQIHLWVVEGVLQPVAGDTPQAWRFAGASLRRAKLAITLTHELEVNAPGVALALDLMDEIESLKASLRRVGRG